MRAPGLISIMPWSTAGDAGKLQVGEWLQTGAASRARITVGNIGSIEVEPNTRVRLVAARWGDVKWH